MIDLILSAPHFLDREKLVQRFLVRNDVLVQLKENLASEQPRHQLIAGFHGMGKTTMLLRLSSLITSDQGLAKRYKPLEFEEEQTVARLSKFYEKCVKSLASSLSHSHEIGDAERLQALIADSNSQSDAELLLQILLEEADRLNRTLVLLVDDAEFVLERLGHDGTRQFAKLLRQDPRVLFIGATSNPYASVFSKGPFAKLFRHVPLEPIGFEETRQLFEELAKQFDDKAVLEWLRNSQPLRLQALRTLSGGNLRTLLYLYETISIQPSGDIKAQVDRLMDRSTERYKAQFRAQAPQARLILHCLSDAWPYLQTARDIAKASGEHVNTVSAQLAKLMASGLVVKGKERRDNKDTFVIPERLWSLWLFIRSHPEAQKRVSTYAEIIQVLDPDPKEAANRLLRDHRSGRPVSPDDVRLRLPSVADPVLRWRLRETIRSKRGAIRDWLDEAKDAYEQRRIDDCILICAKELSSAPDDARALNIYANCLWALGRVDNAKNLYSRAIDIVPEFSTAHANLGKLYVNYYRQFDDAERAFLYATKADAAEDASQAWELLGELYSKLERYEEAETAYRKAISINAANQTAPKGLATLFRTRGRIDEAKTLLQQDESSIGLTNLGSFLCDCKLYDEAKYVLLRATSADPKNSSAFYWLGEALVCLERYDESLEAYRNAVTADKNNSIAFWKLGDLLLDHYKREKDAEAAYRDATRATPWNAFLWANLGWFLDLHRNDFAAAEFAYRRALQLDSQDTNTWRNLGLLLKTLSRPEEAEAAYCQSILADKTNEDALHGLRTLITDQRSHEETERVLRLTVTANPSSILARELLLSLAASRLHTAGWPAAQDLAALALSPNDSGVIEPQLASIFQSVFLTVAIVYGFSTKCIELLDNLRLGDLWLPIREALVAIDNPSHLEQLVPEVRSSTKMVWDALQPFLDVDAAAADGDTERVRRLIARGSKEPQLWRSPRVSEAAHFLTFSEVDTATIELLRPKIQAIEERLVSKPDRRHLSYASLNFFPGCKLLSIEDLDARGQNEQFAIQGPLEGLTFLDWTNEPIYQLAERFDLNFDDADAILYCRFMFHFVRSQLGRFIIVEHSHEIPWNEVASEEIRDKVAKRLMRLEVSEQQRDYVRLKGTVLFKNALFITDFILAKRAVKIRGDSEQLSKGQWSLENEDLILEELPVIVDCPSGVFG